MSLASRRGSDFERKVAAIMRSKLGARVARDRRSGAGHNKADITDYYQDIPLHLELKDQETVKVKEWFRQAEQGASFHQVPTLVFAADEEILATIRFSDLVNFLVEIADQKAEIDDLRQPIDIQQSPSPGMAPITVARIVPGRLADPLLDKLEKPIAQKVAAGVKLCRAGHIADEYGYCNQKGCKYSRGYRPPKGKRK